MFFLSYSHYQDVIINGVVQKSGQRQCEIRYKAIKKILEKYDRPITVLDIGAAEGYFCFRIANDFDATCVMIESNKHLLQFCKKNNSLDKIILLQKRISPSELKKIVDLEHFDVVIALNVIHHFGRNWRKAADNIFKLGDTIIIETPPSEDKGACGQKYIAGIESYLENRGGIAICETPRHTSKKNAKTYLFENQENLLDYQGIKLSTYQSFGGVYPYLERFENVENLVIQGKKILEIN
jgi:cyclopropane fatty-acyl-phospholipid synthase-like methyltransferase